MKVKCIKLLDSAGKPKKTSRYLKIGEIYHVLDVYIEPSGRRMYRTAICKENELPDNDLSMMNDHYIFNAECFEIVTTFVPSSWKIFIYDSGTITLCPFAWHEYGFWKNFNEKKVWAEEVFGESINQIFSNEKLSDRMKVKYIGPHDKGEYYHLDIGNIYNVQEIRINHTGEIFYMCDGGYGLNINTKRFEIVSTNAPSSWKMLVRKNKGILLLPASQLEKKYFWASFFDGDWWAEEVFREERSLIFREEP